MARRKTQVARSRIGEAVIREIWVRAAGRCVLCSSYLLGGGRTYFHHIPHGQVAHNVGATTGKKSPRGKSSLTLDERALPENLLLLCHQCHRMVDDIGAEKIYNEEYLARHKREHEDRVRQVTNFATVTPAAVVRVTGRIRGTLSAATDRQVGAALHYEDLRPAGEHPHDSEYVVTIESEDTDSWVWDEGSKKIATRLAALRDSPHATVAVFAMAPIPLLVFLGSQLDDKSDIRVFPRFRDAEDLACCWRNEPATPAVFELSSSVADATAKDVVVAVSVSGVVDADRAQADLIGAPRVSLRASELGPDAIQTKSDLTAFASAWRRTLAKVESDYPACERIHLLAAVPVVAAVACGQHHMRDAQPALVVYQRAAEEYVEALTVS
ncbi:SAVED domain-containing protein [Herbiconiux moechotypicola]|uniref:SAVED domain-containing protein n=2 Tax=Herbiconiux moechotypicola TaxID=637393 RepID=A0ABN3DGT4_9MICO|nr:SAVED domain-containing protein [Herbiconiux moechotypicola]MCS5729550.1 SAVED domain-containing protein [Herbiconiux moechotypicola]